MPRSSSMRRSSAEPSREIDEHSITTRGRLRAFPRSDVITAFTSSHVETMQKTMSRPASSVTSFAIVAPYFTSGSAFARVRFHASTSAPPRARRAAISYPMRPVPIQPTVLVGVGNGKLLCGIERDDPGALGREHDFLLDACRRDAVLCRAERLDREHHAGLQLVGLDEGVEPRDQRTLVQPEAEPMAEIEAERGHLGFESDLGRLREHLRDLVRGHA